MISKTRSPCFAKHTLSSKEPAWPRNVRCGTVVGVKSKTWKGPMPSCRRPSIVFLWSPVTIHTSAIEPRKEVRKVVMESLSLLMDFGQIQYLVQWRDLGMMCLR